MLIDRTHRGWIWSTLLLTLGAVAAYVPYHLHAPPPGPRGGTWPGLAYGVASLLLLLFAALIGVRRKLRSWNLGRAEAWLKGHIWLGLLAYALMFLHAGFRLGGPLAMWLIALFTLVVATGVHGLIVQHIVPRMLTAAVHAETMVDQIPVAVARLREEAAKVVSEACGPLSEEPAEGEKKKAKQTEPLEGSEPLKRFFLGEVAAYLEQGRGRLLIPGQSQALFAQVRHMSGTSVHPMLERLEAMCEERRQLVTQERLHFWLHGWLLLHLPAAAALVLLSLVHAVASIYY